MKKIIPFILMFALCSLIFKPVISVSSSQSLAKKVIVLDPGHGGYELRKKINDYIT
ncbi:hypothetical protein [Candidatus Stoquefichus massiliensis]|uniref:hypothetical protein n=1 Tax=Candidatus Stoquefichus massiliensis TaxID=1470350 RepID=UPI0004B3D8FA|nr:hypothetical protein [Candidatus Stoquefichus massiliensis]